MLGSTPQVVQPKAAAIPPHVSYPCACSQAMGSSASRLAKRQPSAAKCCPHNHQRLQLRLLARAHLPPSEDSHVVTALSLALATSGGPLEMPKPHTGWRVFHWLTNLWWAEGQQALLPPRRTEKKQASSQMEKRWACPWKHELFL